MAESRRRIQLEGVYHADDSGASGGDESTGGTHVAWDRVKGRGGGGEVQRVYPKQRSRERKLLQEQSEKETGKELRRKQQSATGR
jgi:hypothetical protein